MSGCPSDLASGLTARCKLIRQAGSLPAESAKLADMLFYFRVVRNT